MRKILLFSLTLTMAVLVWGIAPGWGQNTRVVIKDVTVSGNKTTRKSVITRELGIYPGRSIPRDSIDALITQARLRLFNLQIFNEVEQDVEAIGADSVIWHIKVRERWFIIPTCIIQYADRNLNTWWVDQNHDFKRVTAGLTVTDKNFRGNLEQLGVTVQLGYAQKLGFSYIKPYINDKQTKGIGVIVSIEQNRQTYFETDSNKLRFAGAYNGPVIWRKWEGSLCYLYRPGYAHKHLVLAGYRYYAAGDTILRLNGDYFADSSTVARFIELTYRYEYNGTDNWNYSLKGEKVVAIGAFRAGMAGIRQQFVANVEAGIFREPLTHWYVSLITRARFMYPQKQPYYFRNGLGTNTDYVRGYEYYVTDGYNYGLVRLSLKRALINRTLSIPLRYFTAVPVRVYPKVFFDAGYIDNPAPRNNTLVNQLMYSYGAGIDIVSLYDTKIRIEFARNRLGQNGVYLHFNSE